MWSDAVGDTFQISVAECGPDPQSVLVLTDADGLFGLTVDTVRLMQLTALVPSMVIVGIGYPTADTLADTVQIRARDLTPTATGMFSMCDLAPPPDTGPLTTVAVPTPETG